MGLHFRSTSAIEIGVWIWVSTHRGKQQAFRYAENSSSTRPRLSAKQATGPALLAVPRYPASPRAVGTWLQLRCCATTIFASSGTASSGTRRAVAVWEIAVVERDLHSQREEKTTPEDNPSSVKRVSYFPRHGHHAASAWPEMLRCDEPHVVLEGSLNLSKSLSRTAWCCHAPAVKYS